MSTTSLQAVEAVAMQLSPQERADLAERLWQSVAGVREPDAAWDAAWDAEIQRRVADDAAGRTQYLPAQVVTDRLAEHIQRRLAERRG